MTRLPETIARGIDALLTPYNLTISELLECWDGRNGAPDRYIGLKEAVAISGLSRVTLWEAMANGKLRARKMGTTTQAKVLVSQNSLSEWLAGFPEWRPGTGRPERKKCGDFCGDSSLH